MEDKSKSRVTMLALSGVLFITTGFGWAVYNGMHSADQKTASTVGSNSATNNIATNNAVALPTEQQAVIAKAAYPSTSMEDAIRAARASISTNPTAPIGRVAQYQPTTISVAERKSPRHRGSNRMDDPAGYVPPPPDVSQFGVTPQIGYNNTSYVEPAAPAVARKLGVDDVRLVGLIDGKAIFRVNRSVAEELAVQRNFTLGKGETFGDLKLDGVNSESATLRDGSKIATKVLDSVH